MSFKENSKIEQGIIYDEYGYDYSTTSTVVNKPLEILSGIDQYGYARRLELIEDTSNIWRMHISGKMSTQVEKPPASGQEVSIFADTPLSVNNRISPHDTTYIIPNNKTLVIQRIVAGCQGDSSEDGSKVEIIFNDGTEHLINRVFINGATQFNSFLDTKKAIDGTSFVGNGTNSIIIRRIRLSNGEQEIDCALRGYVL